MKKPSPSKVTRNTKSTANPAPEPEAPKGKRIFIVDDHPMMLEGMSRLIDSEPGLQCCGKARSAEEAVAEIPKAKPDLVITDLTLPNRSGMDLIQDLVVLCPDIPIFVYSMHDETFHAERALKAGARGYLMKEAGSEKMLEAIHRILAGEVCVSPKIAAKILGMFTGRAAPAASPVEQLTNREFDVYRLIGQGKSTKEIASQLHISAKTVAVHREHIKEKLNLKTAPELTHHAIRWVERN